MEGHTIFDDWGVNTWNTYNDTKNAFLYKICLNAWILFEEGELANVAFYQRLVDENSSIIQEVIDFSIKKLGSSISEKANTLLKNVLLT